MVVRRVPVLNVVDDRADLKECGRLRAPEPTLVAGSRYRTDGDGVVR